MNFLLPYLPTILAIAGAVGLAFLTPFGSQAVAQFFSRRPAFAVQSPIIGIDFKLIVEPANSAARKRRLLGLRARGINMPDIGVLAEGQTIRWTIDLSRLDWLGEIFKPGEDYEFQFFFFHPELPSEKVLLRFTDSKSPRPATAKSETAHTATIADLILQTASNKTLLLEFSEGIISRAFPTSSTNIRWDRVHDGKEITIFDLNNFEVKGNGGKILAEPRYAWVLKFEKCKSVALRELVLGHTDAGYCTGGVIRFESCENVIVEKCDLFGCGTYGLEFVNCHRVEIIDVTIHSCTYGIMNLERVTDFVVTSCSFRENKGFDQFSITGSNNDVMIKNCNFVRNEADGFMFHFDETSGSFYVNDCNFSDNKWVGLSNSRLFPTQNDNHFTNNVTQEYSWKR